jgi:endonuclease/exonuclease/phosphatase family metal-dependent hydrolase
MKKTFLSILYLFFILAAYAQNKLQVYAVAFYNVENLYDTEKDPRVADDEFTPEGANAWTPEKYRKKLDNMSFVISRLALEHCPSGVAVVGLAEVENRKVLEDLIATKALSDMKPEIVHYNSPDRRGIDVALLYNPRMFKLISSKSFKFVLPDNPRFRTRDQLLITGTLGGDKIHIIVCHWPSRYSNQSSELRESAAALSKQIADSIYKTDNDAKIIIMGDLNDDPTDRSCRVVLNAKKDRKEVEPQVFFNTMWGFYERGIGTLAYLGKWSLFDQMMVSYALLGKDRTTLKFWKSEIFNRDFLIQKEGKNKGYPLRTFSGTQFMNGYSDHFPVVMYLVKEAR